ncbi:UNVERIFIED_ORG: hypothetical protein CLV66_104291 [Actinomadura viridilutea]
MFGLDQFALYAGQARLTDMGALLTGAPRAVP